MSRIANYPVVVPDKVEVTVNHGEVSVKGPLGTLTQKVSQRVKIERIEDRLEFKVNDNSRQANALSGTTRALIANMVTGVTKGFEKKLTLVGVGYRAQAQGDLPKGVKAETPTQTEIVIKGTDKQVVGQVAAEVRRYRSPEPYKGKGVRYTGEQIVLKETKKK